MVRWRVLKMIWGSKEPESLQRDMRMKEYDK